MDSRMNTKRILIFLAFAFGITGGTFLALYLTVGTEDTEKLYRIVYYLNFIVVLPVPALANLATRLITKEGWGNLMLRPNLRRGWRFYLAAWILPFLATIIGAVIYYLIFPRSLDPNLSAARAQYGSDPLLSGASSWTLYLIFMANILILGPILTLPMSFGEEFGWRGYLLPKLMERFSRPDGNGGFDAAGVRKAALLVGVIWGMWHWPWDLFELKLNPGLPVTYLLVRLVSTCMLSVLLSWVTLRSGSIWPAVFGHGMINAAIALATLPLNGQPNMMLGPQPAGLIGGLGYMALTLVLLSSRKAYAKAKESTPDKVPAVTGA